MNKSANYDVLTCAGCLPATGLDYNLLSFTKKADTSWVSAFLHDTGNSKGR